MRFTLLAPLLSLVAFGCSSEPTAVPIEGETPAAEQPQTSSADPGSGGGIAPMTSGAAGGVTPVTGAESVQGGGSGVNQAAKDKARDVAAGAGSGSLGAGTGDE
ncbi:MAG: hypothetical protein AB7F50_09190 [Fimbriimonadaceae bacterium]